jgi:MscS family membrane protein
MPRSTILGFLQACRDGDYERAAAYLDLSRLNQRDRAAAGPTLARRLKVVLDHTLWLDVEALSDDPNGHRDDRLPPNRERLGTISAKRGSVDVLLERVPRDDGVLIWKIAALTVAQITALDKEFGYGLLGEWLPAPLFEISFLGIELWQWIGLTVLLVAAILMAWVLTALLARLVRPSRTSLARSAAREGGAGAGGAGAPGNCDHHLLHGLLLPGAVPPGTELFHRKC